MNLKKGDRVLCVENNSTVRPLVIESTDDGKVLFSKQLDKGVKKTFGLKEGSFQLIKPRYISEHEKKEYINPELDRHDRVRVIHVDGSDENNLLGRNATVIGIKENNRGDREVWLWVDGLSSNADSKTPNPVPYILTLEQGTMETNYPHESIPGDRIQKSLVYKLDEPKGKREDYIDDLLHIFEQTEEKKQDISPELEVGDRIMAWDIPGGNPLYIDIDGTQVSADIDKSAPSTFIATVIDVLDIYNPAYGNGIKYLVKIEDTDEVIGLYGGEWLGGTKYPVRDKYHPDTRDKWLKLPKIGITEDSDIFGQGLLDPIEPEEFEGEDEEWDELVGGVEDDKFVVEPEYDYEGGKTNPEVGFVAPSAEVTDNICRAKGFCEAQGPITFGQLKALVEEATKKRISGDIGRGVFKTLWRIIPFFIPQVLLAAVGVTVTRAFNKIITPSLKNTRGYKNWWGKVVLKAMDVAEGDYIPDVALGDDPLSKIFFISDGLLQMIRDKYKLKFARYVADYASSRPDNEPVPEWFVENLLRDYLNQKFLLDPPFEPKEGTDFQMIREHEEEMDPEDGVQTRGPFTKTEIQILNYLAKEFTWEELNTISSVDETQIYGDLDRKWQGTIKLFGEYPTATDDSWIKSSRWAKWAVENWEEAEVKVDDNSTTNPRDFSLVTNPVKSWPSWFEVDADESYWQKEYRSGTIELGAYDRDDAEERANLSWWDYDPDMEHYDYGDTDDHELDTSEVRHIKTLNEHDLPQDQEVRDTIQDIVSRVYPQIVDNLGKSRYINEIPQVELHKDIYERLSGIEGMVGEESGSSEAEYDDYENKIFVYYPNMKDEKHIIQSLLHEYTHSLQDPKKRKKHRELGYENDPDEIEAVKAELNWREYLKDNTNLESKTINEDKMDEVPLSKIIGDNVNNEEFMEILNRFPEKLQRELLDERPKPEDFIEEFKNYDLNFPQPIEIDLEDELDKEYTWKTIGRTPQDVADAINDEWDTDFKSIEVFDQNPSRYFEYAKFSPDTAKPSLMVNGEIAYGVARFVAALLRGDETMRVWDITRKEEKENIKEHKESKLNPDLMVGDEIVVVANGHESFDKRPELYVPYVVIGIKHTNVPGSSMKSLHPYYEIEPIDMTDEDRLGAILAGGGKRRQILLYPGDQWILSSGFLRGGHQEELDEFCPMGKPNKCTPVDYDKLPDMLHENTGGVWDYIFGDSIAYGLNTIANVDGWQKGGANPEKVYNEIINFTEDMSGKKVLLSSGYSNDYSQTSWINEQIDYLKELGATVYLLGVSNTYQKFLDKKNYSFTGDHNGILKDIATTKQVEFLPGFEAGDDNVHPLDYSSLYSSISTVNESAPFNEHAGDRNMKGFTPKLIGYLKFMFETTEISNDYEFVKEATSLFNISEWEAQALYLILKYNRIEVSESRQISGMLNNMPIEDYIIPFIWEYEITYYGEYERISEEEECSGDGFGEDSGEECYCEEGVTYVQNEDGDEVEEECDFEQDDECECIEFERKEYEMYYNNICTKTVYSTTKLENTHEGSDEAYGYEEMYEIDNELGDANSVIESEGCDLDYDDGQVWDYFHDRDDEIIGLETDKWVSREIPNLLEKINNKIYGIKPLIDIIEDQYDVMSDRDIKMKDLTSQIFDILDDNFDMFEHPEGEIEYDGKNMGLYSHHNDSFVPFEHIYNPIMQMLEGGIQQEDIEVFVEIITNWVNYVMSEKREHLNEEVNIKSDDSNYSQEDYEKFVDFAHKELNIEKDCPIDVEVEKSSEYTTGNYHINDRKIKILDNGRKLADILRTIAHELVHHKQNELGMLVGEIPEIGGKIEDQANAYAGRLVKKYGKQTPNLYTESRIDIISEEKVVGFKTPNNNFVVIAGGPGAGKSFITKNLVNLDNVKEFNVDQVRVMTAKKLWGDEWEEKISTEEGYDEILRRTFTTSDPRNLTVKFLKQFLQSERDQPVNVVYDAGGGQEQVMKDIHQLAKENGFITTLVHVRTPLDVAQERNIERPRSLPPEMVAQYHQQVKDNMRNMIPIFDNVWTVDNKELIDLSNRPADNIEKLK